MVERTRPRVLAIAPSRFASFSREERRSPGRTPRQHKSVVPSRSSDRLPLFSPLSYIAVNLGAKTGTICKHVGHIFTKLSVENRTSTAVVALETCRSFARQSEPKPGARWAAISGAMATQIAELWSGAWEICDALSLAA